MALSLLTPNTLADAARVVAAGPYVAGAATTRPWLRLLGVVALSVVFGLGLVFVAGMGLGAYLAAIGQPLDPAMFEPGPTTELWTLDGEVQLLVMLAVALGLLALGVLAAACVVYQKSPKAFLWPAQRNGIGQFLIGLGAMMLLMIVLWPVMALFEPLGPAPVLDARLPVDDRLIYALVATAGLLVAAAAEEVAFRGVLLRVLGSVTRSVPVILIVSALLFSAIHLDPDPVAFVARAMSGLVWAWAVLRLGGLAFSIGAHLGNNLFIALLLEPMSSAALPGQDISPLLLGFELVVVLMMLLLVEILARRRKTPA